MSKFKNGKNYTPDLLEEIILQGVGESGKVPMAHADGGFVELTVEDTEVDFTVPANAGSATIMVQADATATDSTKAIRFTENDATPTNAFGFVLGDGDFYEVAGDMLNDFSMISAEVGKSHKVFVQFYESIATV